MQLYTDYSVTAYAATILPGWPWQLSTRTSGSKSESLIISLIICSRSSSSDRMWAGLVAEVECKVATGVLQLPWGFATETVTLETAVVVGVVLGEQNFLSTSSKSSPRSSAIHTTQNTAHLLQQQIWWNSVSIFDYRLSVSQFFIFIVIMSSGGKHRCTVTVFKGRTGRRAPRPSPRHAMSTVGIK